MGHGFQVINPSGFVQIDADYKNYSLHVSGVAVSGTGGYWEVNFPALDHMPIVLVRFHTANYWLITEPSPSGISGHIVNNEGTSGVAGLTVEFAVFRRDVILSDQTYGIRVWNSYSQLCFDSGRKPLRMSLSTVLHPYWGTTEPTRTITFSPAINAAWMQVHYSVLYQMEWFGSSSVLWLLGLRSIGPGQIQAASIRLLDDAGSNVWEGITRRSGVVLRPDIFFTSGISEGI